MKVNRLMLCVALIGLGANARAAIIIPTNQNGADVDVREHEITDNFGTTEATRQRGSVNELNTSGLDTTTVATGDRSSVMYMKFDISGLPNHTANPGFWSDKNLYFRGYVRNTNLGDSRIAFPNATSPTHIVNFDIRGLEPNPYKNGVDASGGYRYADDDPSAASRTDRSGNAYSSPHYEYNWDEGTGTGIAGDPNQGSGITFVDAPGITPFCMAAGSCATEYGDADANNINKTLGVFDDFNSDARFLGKWQWPLPKGVSAGSNRYPVGLPLEYTDANGNLKQLVFDAQDAGRSFVTLMVNLGVDTLAQANGGTFPGSNSFLNHSYLFIPKDMTTLNNDNNWDPDGPGPLGTIGSPYSCSGTNCNGDGTPNGDTVLRTLGDNSTGAFSPQLIVRVPEPASMVLLSLGAAACGMARRRK